jgi:crotonobetainyl-CoA:carnitine CoA-transferase CaiB-like acyl-CoA transferase
MSGVYDGLTVVELADRRNQWAGKLLADGGARVIQIEPPAGSPGRWCGPFVDDKVDPDRCLDYWWYNTGKQSVSLDVGRQPAQDLLRRLLTRADIFLESTPPGTLRGHGLDYASVSSNRALIYASLTDFGQDGPWRDYQMNDAGHLALGGHMASSGYSDPTLTPIGGQGHQAWHMGCVFALHGITLALFDRMTSGQGQYIDVSIHDACSIGTESAVPEWMYNGATLYRQTGQHASARRRPGHRAADGRRHVRDRGESELRRCGLGQAARVDGGEGRRRGVDRPEIPRRGRAHGRLSPGHRRSRRHPPAGRRLQG